MSYHSSRKPMAGKMPHSRPSLLSRWTTEVVIFLIILVVFAASLGLVKKPISSDPITSAAHPLVRPARAKAMMSVGIGAKLLDMEACAHAGQHLVGRVRVVPHTSTDCSPTPANDIPTCTTREGDCQEGCTWDAHGLSFVRPLRERECAPTEPLGAATYQRRNLRNMLAALSAHAQGRLVGWQDWSPSARLDNMRVSLDGLTLRGDVLDYGADPAGRQPGNGTITGFNIAPPFSPASVTTTLGPRVAMVFGPANKPLPFPSASFDHVVSLNVMEHVSDMRLYLTEAQRVLRVCNLNTCWFRRAQQSTQVGGVLYLNWYPVWTGPRGHHVHPGMVAEWEAARNCPPSGYRNDGTFFPDWGHLLTRGPGDLGAVLANTSLGRCPGLVEHIADYALQQSDLNRATYAQVMRLVQTELPSMQLLVATNLPTDEGVVLTDELEARLKAVVPEEEHFALGEVVLVLEKTSSL